MKVSLPGVMKNALDDLDAYEKGCARARERDASRGAPITYAVMSRFMSSGF